MGKLIEPGALVEPVSVDEVKIWLGIDAEYTGDDDLLAVLITSERERIEKHLNVALVDRDGLKYYAPTSSYCSRSFRLPFADQVAAIVSVTDKDSDDTSYDFDIASGLMTVSGTATVTYDVEKIDAAALLVCLRKLVATAYKYREDLQSEAVYKLQESALDQVETFSNNLYL